MLKSVKLAIVCFVVIAIFDVHVSAVPSVPAAPYEYNEMMVLLKNLALLTARIEKDIAEGKFRGVKIETEDGAKFGAVS